MGIQHRSYFDGSVQSLELLTDEGRATVGVIEPGEFRFDATEEEHIQVISGVLRVRPPGSAEWVEYRHGETCDLPAGSVFGVAAREAVAYICHYGPRTRDRRPD